MIARVTGNAKGSEHTNRSVGGPGQARQGQVAGVVDRELVVSVISVRTESGSVVEGARGRPRRSRGRSRLGRRWRGLDSVDNDSLGGCFSKHKAAW